MKKSILALSLLLTLPSWSAAQTTPASPSVSEYTQKVTQIRQTVYEAVKADDAKSGKSTPRAEIEAKIAAKVRDLMQGLGNAPLEERDFSEWAALYRAAGMDDRAAGLETSAYQYHNIQLMFTATNLIPTYIQKGQDEKAYFLIKHVPSIEPGMVGMIGETVLSACKRAGYDQKKPEFVEKCLRTLRNQLDLEPSPDRGSRVSMADYCYVDLSMKILELRYERKPDPAVLKDMDWLKRKFAKSTSTNAFGQSPGHRVDDFLLRQSALGQPAPELIADKQLGGFKSLAALKGKVVVLDFMAHWCGPCKAALPWLKKLQDTYGPQGMQAVSVTSFYGYFGTRQNVKVDAEFDLMKIFVQQYNMTWPVVFDVKQLTHSKYHVGAIPHLVVIDRKGAIRRVQVGAGEDEEAKTAELVKTLVSEEK